MICSATCADSPPWTGFADHQPTRSATRTSACAKAGNGSTANRPMRTREMRAFMRERCAWRPAESTSEAAISRNGATVRWPVSEIHADRCDEGRADVVLVVVDDVAAAFLEFLVAL